MSHKRADDLAYPPRAMRVERAAAYLDISTAAFLRLVDDGALPPATKKNGIVSWDRFDLDTAYENWKDENGPHENTMHKLLRGNK
jgi:hypothetical protein